MGHSLQIWAYVIISIAFALGTSSLLLRLYCRWRLKTFGHDDAAAAFLIGVNAVQQAILYIFLYNGCGLPVNQAPPDITQNINKWLFVEEVFYMFTHFVLKQSYLLFYLRLSPNGKFCRIVYATMILCVLFLLVEWLLAFLQVQPLDAYFKPQLYPHPKRLSQYVVQMVPTALNALSDIIILVIPIPMVLRLQMSTRRKAVVLGIMAFGSLSVVTALCRFIVQKQLISEEDTSYIMGRMIIVAGIEIQIAVIAVNLPALRSLFSNFVGSSNMSAPDSSAHGLSSMNRYKGKASNKSAGYPKKTENTLSGSEENLMRLHGVVGEGEDILVVTNVEVSSQKLAST